MGCVCLMGVTGRCDGRTGGGRNFFFKNIKISEQKSIFPAKNLFVSQVKDFCETFFLFLAWLLYIYFNCPVFDLCVWFMIVFVIWHSSSNFIFKSIFLHDFCFRPWPEICMISRLSAVPRFLSCLFCDVLASLAKHNPIPSNSTFLWIQVILFPVHGIFCFPVFNSL